MRLIDGDALLEYLQEIPIDLGYREVEEIEKFVKGMPTILTPVPAHWIPIRRGERGYSAGGFRCSQCGTPDRGWGKTNYCPQCGAWMHGGKQNETT